MRKLLIFVTSFVLFFVSSLSVGPIMQGVQNVLADQKKRDACYAIGVANLPSGEDQTMLQGSLAYQKCLTSK